MANYTSIYNTPPSGTQFLIGDTVTLISGDVWKYAGNGQWVASVDATQNDTVTASKTLTLGDSGRYMLCNSDSPIVLTVPSDAIAGWSGTVTIPCYRGGTGSVTFAPGDGVTINGDLFIPTIDGSKRIVRVGTNEWSVVSSNRFDHKWDEVFVIHGQSNADGRGVSDGTSGLPSQKVILYDKTENIRTATEPTGAIGTGWVNNNPSGSTPSPLYGFPVAMGKSISALTGITPLLVPCAIGSTTFYQWSLPDQQKDMTTLFGAMHARADNVKFEDRPPVFVLFGHESGPAITESLITGVYKNQYAGCLHRMWDDIRTYFPSAPILYAQLSTCNVGATATYQRHAGQAMCDVEDIGSPGTVTPLSGTLSMAALGTNATNTISFSENVIRMIGDGTTALGFRVDSPAVQSGHKYRVRVRSVGSGIIKLTSGATEIFANFSAGYWTWIFDSVGTTFTIYRTSGATDLTITLEGIDEITSISYLNAHMIVTHDVPRNASTDDIHVSTIGQKEVGRRFAIAYAQHVLGLPEVDGTGPRLVSVTSTDSTHTSVKFSQALAAAKSGEENYGDGTNSLFRVYDGGTEKSVSSVAIDGGDATALIITHASCSGVRVVTYGDRAGQNAQWRKGVVYNTTTPLPLPAPMFGPVISA